MFASIEKLTTPVTPSEQNELTYWRERILLWGLLISAVLGFFAYIAGLGHFIREGMWGIIAVDTVVYGIILLLFIFRRLPYFIRAGSAVFILYALGIYLLYAFGFYAGGILWLFAFPVMTGVFLGMRAALAALVLTTISMGIIDYLVARGMIAWSFPALDTSERMISIETDFMLLCITATASLGIVINRLQEALAERKVMQVKLETENAERKLAEKKLRDSQRRLIAAQHIAKLGDFTWDVETGETTWSDAIYDILKYDKFEKIDYAKINAKNPSSG